MSEDASFYRLVFLANSPGRDATLAPSCCEHAAQLRPARVAELNKVERRLHTRGRFVPCNVALLVTFVELAPMVCDGCRWWRDDCRCRENA